MEIIIVGIILIFIVTYRSSTGKGVYKFINQQATHLYNKYAPYSYKEMRSKIKSLGLDYTPKQYLTQIVLFAGIAGVVGYLYFYNLIVSIVYAVIAIAFIPYITYLRSKRQYSEFIFEQIQVYVTNTIMEFATTQAFIKSLEGVVESGILEDPVLSDVKTMIALSYEKGEVTDSIANTSFNGVILVATNPVDVISQLTATYLSYPYETFDNMLTDIDALVEGVYRDRMDRSEFHKQFLIFGVALYGIVMLIQLLLGVDSYIAMLDNVIVVIMLHALVLINTLFLLRGEKYYNENVGAE